MTNKKIETHTVGIGVYGFAHGDLIEAASSSEHLRTSIFHRLKRSGKNCLRRRKRHALPRNLDRWSSY